MPRTPAACTPPERRLEEACLRAAADSSVVEFPLELLESSEAHLLEAGLQRGDIEHDEEPTLLTGAVRVAAVGALFETMSGRELKLSATLHFPTSIGSFGRIIGALECASVGPLKGSSGSSTRSLLNVEMLRCPAMALEPHVVHDAARLAKELIAHFHTTRQVTFRYGLGRALQKFRAALEERLAD